VNVLLRYIRKYGDEARGSSSDAWTPLRAPPFGAEKSKGEGEIARESRDLCHSVVWKTAINKQNNHFLDHSAACVTRRHQPLTGWHGYHSVTCQGCPISTPPSIERWKFTRRRYTYAVKICSILSIFEGRDHFEIRG
jgi:hypothetical protein